MPDDKKKKKDGVQPFVTSDPKEYAFRKKAYDDSLLLHNNSVSNIKFAKNYANLPYKAKLNIPYSYAVNPYVTQLLEKRTGSILPQHFFEVKRDNPALVGPRIFTDETFMTYEEKDSNAVYFPYFKRPVTPVIKKEELEKDTDVLKKKAEEFDGKLVGTLPIKKLEEKSLPKIELQKFEPRKKQEGAYRYVEYVNYNDDGTVTYDRREDTVPYATQDKNRMWNMNPEAKTAYFLDESGDKTEQRETFVDKDGVRRWKQKEEPTSFKTTDLKGQVFKQGGYLNNNMYPEGGPINTSGPRAEETPSYMDSMVKGRMATASALGNPSAQRMTFPYPKTGMTPEGEGTHYMSSVDNFARPLLQDKGGINLEYIENPGRSSEDIKFNTPEEADYFAKNYKNFAPMMNQYNNGGQLTEFTEGGSHEQNQNGGIPQGIGANGQPNLVEEGETKLDAANYIFSDSLILDKQTVEDFNLDKKYIGKTFAEASKKLGMTESRRENDEIENNQIKEDLDTLMNAQEVFKQRDLEKDLAMMAEKHPEFMAQIQGAQGGQEQAPQEQAGQPQMSPEEQAMMEQQMMTEQQGGGQEQPSEEEMMAMQQQGGEQPPMMRNGGSLDDYYKKPNSYNFGGKIAQFVGNYGKGIADSALGIVGAEDVIGDNAYSGAGAGFAKKAADISGTIGKTVLPVAANIIAPGSGAIVSGAQGMIGNMTDKPEEEVMQQQIPGAIQMKYGGNMYFQGGGLDPTPGLRGAMEYSKNMPVEGLDMSQSLFQDGAIVSPNGLVPQENTSANPYANIDFSQVGNTGQYKDTRANSNPTSGFDSSYEIEKLATKPVEKVNSLSEDFYNMTPAEQSEYLSRLAKADENLGELNNKTNIKESPLGFATKYVPVAYNLGRGLFGKAETRNPEDYYTNLNAFKMNVDLQLRNAEQTFATGQNALRNASSGGAYLSNMQALARNKDASIGGIYANKENVDNQMAFEASKINNQNKNQAKMFTDDYNQRAKAAKEQFLQQGLQDLKGISESDTENKLSTAYINAVAPDYKDTVTYTPFSEQLSKRWKEQRVKKLSNKQA